MAQEVLIGSGATVVVKSDVSLSNPSVLPNNFTINDDGALIIQDNGRIFLRDTMLVEGGGYIFISDGGEIITPGTEGSTRILLKSDANYINAGTASPYLEVRQLIEGVKGWRMLSSPLTGTYARMFDNFVTQGYPGATYPEKQHNLLWFDETAGGTTLNSWRVPASASANVSGGKGHYFYIFDGAGITTGGSYPDTLPRIISTEAYEYALSGGSFSYDITHTPRTPVTDTNLSYVDVQYADAGWNLIGNPTASTLDWDASSAWTRTGIDSTIYIWDPAEDTAGAFLYYNGITGTLPNGKINPFQAFWVHANSSSPVLSFSNDAKTVDGDFVKLERGELLELVLMLSSKGMKTSAFITFMDEGNTGRDPFDAYHLQSLSDSWIQLFTLGSVSHKDALVINNLPPLEESLHNLPLFVGGQLNGQGLNGIYQLDWDIPSTWPGDWNISLHDHKLKKAISMVKNQRYSFSYGDNTKQAAALLTDEFLLPTRVVTTVDGFLKTKSGNQLPPFSIIIQKGDPNEEVDYIDLEPALLPNYPNPFRSATTLRLSLPQAGKVVLRLFDIQGHLLQEPLNRSLDAGLHEIQWQNPGYGSGIYLLQLQTADHQDVIRLNILK